MIRTAIDRRPLLVRQTTPEDAKAAATEFLLDFVGSQLVANSPVSMTSALRSVWIVPVSLAYIHTGSLGEIGVIAVDEETGEVVAWTPIDQMKAESRALRAAREPQISEQFRAFISTDNQSAGL
ncbi:MAG: hypothetical protein DWI57_05670 [Chloroflexi bacterium]|nr:MAG: hypothetical protein DWI57_05670 [Chloroflexota bacterium]